MSDFIFSSESVTEGHPDKIADQISDAVLDAVFKEDPFGRVACETFVTTGMCLIGGEISTTSYVDIPTLVRSVIREIGYTDAEYGLSDETCAVLTTIDQQSSDIAMGVDRAGAGDQGMMFGYASNATPQLMPAPIVYAHSLLQFFTTLRKNGEIAYLRPDSKAQVSVLHEDGNAKEISSVVISHQTREVPIKRIRKELEEVARAFLKDTGMLTNKTKFYINPTGRFVVGGPCGDSGLTGRKIIVDTYGGVGSHGGGAFSGKDPSKVDRSAAYYCRYAAKNIVAAGLADKCEIQVAYAIGVAKPLSINVSTYGTGKVPEALIEKILMANEIFDFRPGMLIKDLGLTKPKGWSYRTTSNYGHFGREGFPWEKTNRVAALRSAVGLK